MIYDELVSNVGFNDNLRPCGVAAYCASRGYLQLFWECGGELGAPALSDGVIHHVMAFVAPKIIGSAGGQVGMRQ